MAVRSYRCGKPNCACHGDPPRLHDPYIQWSRSVGGRTKEMVAELEALTLGIVEGDDRWPSR